MKMNSTVKSYLIYEDDLKRRQSQKGSWSQNEDYIKIENDLKRGNHLRGALKKKPTKFWILSKTPLTPSPLGRYGPELEMVVSPRHEVPSRFGDQQ